MYSIEEYFDDYDAYGTADPYDRELMFEVVVYDECVGTTIEGVVWGEGIDYVREDIAALLDDCEAIMDIVNVF